MLMVVSPAKNLDFASKVTISEYTQPAMLDDAEALVKHCRTLAPEDLSSLMGISDKLATLNAERFHSFQTPFTEQNARQAIYAFNGDVYTGLDAASLRATDMQFAQQHLRILSGLYGVLRPLDLMQAYRLEMGTKLANSRGKSLYEFWGESITDNINQALAEQGDNVLVNLASNEYFSAVKKKSLNGMIITPQFKDEKNGQFKMISFYAKKARGLMARYIIQNQLTEVSQLKEFDSAGYYFDSANSTETDLIFLRNEADR